ncbi:MAG TPA: organomercurial lyase [Myxococcaceae bacterium]|nr:organomercurial lyase [Myxococcaceae bacterium]
MPHLPIDARVHQALIAGILRDGHPPYQEEVAARLQVDVPAIHASLHRLHAHHGLMLLPGTSLVWMIHPFSLSPTATWVSSGEKGWWAPCLWCAMGISVLSGGDAQIRTRLGGESEEICIKVHGDQLSEQLLVHFPLPPKVAWNNVIHWCASVQAFRDAASVEKWCKRHGYGLGELVPLDRVLALGRLWYGRHLAPDWRKWTNREAEAIFRQAGLTGPFWALEVDDAHF